MKWCDQMPWSSFFECWVLSQLFHSPLSPSSGGSFRSDQSLSRVRLFATPWIAAHQASLSIINSRSSLRLTSIESVTPSSHLILCRPLLLLPPIPLFHTTFNMSKNLFPKLQSIPFCLPPASNNIFPSLELNSEYWYCKPPLLLTWLLFVWNFLLCRWIWI